MPMNEKLSLEKLAGLHAALDQTVADLARCVSILHRRVAALERQRPRHRRQERLPATFAGVLLRNAKPRYESLHGSGPSGILLYIYICATSMRKTPSTPVIRWQASRHFCVPYTEKLESCGCNGKGWSAAQKWRTKPSRTR